MAATGDVFATRDVVDRFYAAFLAGFELGFKLLYGQSCRDGRVGRG